MREQIKEEVLGRFREAARQAVSDALRNELFTFEHGTLFQQLKAELNELEAALIPDGIVAARKNRKHISPGKRRNVFKRDRFACQECGWRGDPSGSLTPRHFRQGRHLTLDHIIPESEGGSNEMPNLRTLCTVCNNKKGRALPTVAPWVAV